MLTERNGLTYKLSHEHGSGLVEPKLSAVLDMLNRRWPEVVSKSSPLCFNQRVEGDYFMVFEGEFFGIISDLPEGLTDENIITSLGGYTTNDSDEITPLKSAIKNNLPLLDVDNTDPRFIKLTMADLGEDIPFVYNGMSAADVVILTDIQLDDKLSRLGLNPAPFKLLHGRKKSFTVKDVRYWVALEVDKLIEVFYHNMDAVASNGSFVIDEVVPYDENFVTTEKFTALLSEIRPDLVYSDSIIAKMFNIQPLDGNAEYKWHRKDVNQAIFMLRKYPQLFTLSMTKPQASFPDLYSLKSGSAAGVSLVTEAKLLTLFEAAQVEVKVRDWGMEAVVKGRGVSLHRYGGDSNDRVYDLHSSEEFVDSIFNPDRWMNDKDIPVGPLFGYGNNTSPDPSYVEPLSLRTAMFIPEAIVYNYDGFVIARGVYDNRVAQYACRWHDSKTLGYPNGMGKPQWLHLPATSMGLNKDGSALLPGEVIMRFRGEMGQIKPGSWVRTAEGWHLVNYVYGLGDEMLSAIGLGKRDAYPITYGNVVEVREGQSVLSKFHSDKIYVWMSREGKVFVSFAAQEPGENGVVNAFSLVEVTPDIQTLNREGPIRWSLSHKRTTLAYTHQLNELVLIAGYHEPMWEELFGGSSFGDKAGLWWVNELDFQSVPKKDDYSPEASKWIVEHKARFIHNVDIVKHLKTVPMDLVYDDVTFFDCIGVGIPWNPEVSVDDILDAQGVETDACINHFVQE